MKRFALTLAVLTACSSNDTPADTDPLASSSSTSTGPSSSSTTEDETDSSTTEDPTADTDESSSSTGDNPPACSDTVPCLEPALPFCVDDVCSTCEAAEVPNDACASVDPLNPFCAQGACVPCSADGSACEGVTPLCEVETNTCAPCRFHEDCIELGAPACNIATGACFDPANVSDVNGATDGAIASAIAELPDGAEHVIRLTSGGGNNAITVDGGKTIAIVSSEVMATRTIQGETGSPTVSITDSGATLYLHHMRLSGNTSDEGVAVTAGTLYADATQVAQNTGGGITLASGTSGFLRNCMVAGDGGNPGEPAISASNATVDVLYSTLGLDFNSGGAVLSCSGGDVVVRNSIVISEAATAGAEIDCAGAVVENTAEESTLSPTDWFPQFASGDYSLSTAGGMEFEGDAVWELGDPPTDFDGDDRPSTDGTPDFAGADVP